MNKRIDFSQNGGLHVYQDTLDFMQQSYRNCISAIANAFGNRVVLNGVIDSGATYSAGWVIIDGELMPFLASNKTANIVVEEIAANETFEDGTTKQVYFTKQAKCGIVGGFPISSFVWIDNVSAISNNLRQARADIDKLGNVLNRLDKVEKMLKPLMGYNDTAGNTVYGSWLFWGRPAIEIPAGWEPVPDTDWKGRVPVVLDESQYEFGYIGQTGGEKAHTLTVSELPNTQLGSVKISDRGWPKQSGDRTDRGGHLVNDNFDSNNPQVYKEFPIGSAGGGLAHNNLQPYKVVMFIRFVG